MSNEIKNRQHAIALIAPVPAAPFTTPIVSEVGVSSFVRNGAGNYTVALTDAAPFHTTRTSASLGANVLGTIGAQLAPDGGSVLVTAFDALGVPFDPQYFDLAVDVIRDGEGVGPAPAAPAVPPPPAFGATPKLICWGDVNTGGNVTQQSPNLIDGIDNTDPGRYEGLMLAAAPDLASVQATIHAAPGGTLPGFVSQEIDNVDVFVVWTYDAAGVATNRAFSICLYQL